MQEKTQYISVIVKTIGLNISEAKTEVITRNTKNNISIKVYGKYIKLIDSFTYTGNMVRKKYLDITEYFVDSPASIARTSNSNCRQVVYYHHSSIALSGKEYLKVTLKNCQLFI